jgi:hypothetical protein
VGAHAPSPGAVYPTLTLPAEQDYWQSKKAAGGRKPYSMRAEGVSFLAQHKDTAAGVKARMDLAAQALSNHSTPEMVREAFHTLPHALHMQQGPWSQEQASRVGFILAKAARDILGDDRQA